MESIFVTFACRVMTIISPYGKGLDSQFDGVL